MPRNAVHSIIAGFLLQTGKESGERDWVMGLHHLVEEFSIKAPRCRGDNDLFNLTEAVSRELGLPSFAMVHGLWFRLPGDRLIFIDNFKNWSPIFIARKYYLDDPGLLVAQRTNSAFLWSDTRKLLPGFSRRHELILKEAARHDLRLGFTVPIGVMGEPHGCFSFATDGELPSVWHLRAATLIAGMAFHEARRLHGFPRRARRVPRLSFQKLQCLRLVASGKTDEQMAEILGVGLSTVRTHMALLRRAFDVHSRAQLMAEALRFGFIGYDDILPM